MNAYIYGGFSRISSTQTFEQYRQSESYNQAQRAVNKNGDLLDYETLELRVHPPNIQIKVEDKETLITLDSANKPGTLIEVRGSSAWYCGATEWRIALQRSADVEAAGAAAAGGAGAHGQQQQGQGGGGGGVAGGGMGCTARGTKGVAVGVSPKWSLLV